MNENSRTLNDLAMTYTLSSWIVAGPCNADVSDQDVRGHQNRKCAGPANLSEKCRLSR